VSDYARYYNLKFFYYSKFKKKEIIYEIKKFKPDYIFNSSSVYFDKNLLNLPKFFCINRHSSILPSYGGLLPVFHMIKDKKKFFGASLIKMSSKIDSGKVISQKQFYDNSKNMFKIYKRSFKCSLLLIDKFLFKKKRILLKKNSVSYFGIPNAQDEKKFYYEKAKII
ncbi:formyltransferase family protein, partial [Candidatus Pelagibacter sp.]|nr:formyltransferase family protein [Candidatus Pelagibacter sp.]